MRRDLEAAHAEASQRRAELELTTQKLDSQLQETEYTQTQLQEARDCIDELVNEVGVRDEEIAHLRRQLSEVEANVQIQTDVVRSAPSNTVTGKYEMTSLPSSPREACRTSSTESFSHELAVDTAGASASGGGFCLADELKEEASSHAIGPGPDLANSRMKARSPETAAAVLTSTTNRSPELESNAKLSLSVPEGMFDDVLDPGHGSMDGDGDLLDVAGDLSKLIPSGDSVFCWKGIDSDDEKQRALDALGLASERLVEREVEQIVAMSPTAKVASAGNEKPPKDENPSMEWHDKDHFAMVEEGSASQETPIGESASEKPTPLDNPNLIGHESQRLSFTAVGEKAAVSVTPQNIETTPSRAASLSTSTPASANIPATNAESVHQWLDCKAMTSAETGAAGAVELAPSDMPPNCEVKASEPPLVTHASRARTRAWTERVALYKHSATENEQLSFVKGQLLYLAPGQPPGKGWLLAENSEGDRGFVPANYLKAETSAPVSSASAEAVKTQTTDSSSLTSKSSSQDTKTKTQAVAVGGLLLFLSVCWRIRTPPENFCCC